MNKKLEEIILQIALEDYESGHTTAADKESFNKILKDDFNIEVGDEAFDFYTECRNMGPSGFYLMYKDELDFSPEFKSEYGFEEDPEAVEEIIEESLMEANKDEGSFKVQQIDSKGNKLDQFANFATADEAIAFAKTLKTPAEVIDNTLSESLEEEKVIWTNLDTLEEALSRDDMIADLKAKGKNYNFNKYTDAQIYRMHQREMNKEVVKPTSTLADIDNEEDVEYIETSNCPHCNHQLTDAGQCPVCDLGDEEERSSHTLYLDESLFNETITYPNGVEVLEDSVDLDKALDYMYGTDRDPDNSIYTEEEKQKAIDYWIKKTDPSPYNESLNEEALNEGPFSKKSIADTINKAQAKDDKAKTNLRNNLSKILSHGLNDKSNSFLLNGEWVTYDDFIQAINPKSISPLIRMGDELKDFEMSDAQRNKLVSLIDTVVRNKNGYIIRRGLELLRDKTVPFNPTRMDLVEIKDGYRAEDIIGVRSEGRGKNTADNETQSKEQPKTDSQTNPKPADNSQNNQADNTSTEQKASEQTKTTETPKGVTDKTIQNTINAAKVFGMNVYTMQGGSIEEMSDAQLKHLGANTNMEKIWVGKDKNSRVTLSQLANELKKRNIVESLDDEIEYDNLEEDVITHHSLEDGDMEELLSLAKELGIHTVGELNQFAEREVPQGMSLLDVMKQYRDDLGDDFELKENFDISPKTLVESYQETETDIDISWFNV